MEVGWRIDAQEIKEGRDIIYVGKQLGVDDTTMPAFPGRQAEDEGNLDAGIVEGALGARHGDTVVGSEDDEGVRTESEVVESADDPAELGINMVDSALELRKLEAGAGGVEEITRNLDTDGIVRLNRWTEETMLIGGMRVRIGETVGLDETDG